ncbi:proline--tRNA ligase [Patescibacteria group bacterium]|nr:proline--tRNA ligase [Patescibacteria group bacterium]
MSESYSKKNLTKKSDRFSDWYTDVILKAELADYAPVKGCMVIRPYGYAIWEGIQRFMDERIKERGVENAYFPIFIPEKFLNREKEHVAGFAPHMAVVTYAGGEELKEKLVVRPTSETIMYEMFKEWTHSYRDLPVRINQWNNVVRWEKRTYLFLRTSEFLWQEGHCAHVSHKESLDTVDWALNMYIDTYQKQLAMYGIAGRKSETEKFAGAQQTFTYEILMPDGKALQGCTSHDLGQNFAKAFDWHVQDDKGEKLFPWQNSWGFSTRSIGGLIMVHGDDQGLILPPNIAPIQAIVIPIPGSSDAVFRYAETVVAQLKAQQIRVKVDARSNESAGFKFNKWELKGVPVRIEIGENEFRKEILTGVFRHNQQRTEIKPYEIQALLTDLQQKLFERHKEFTEKHTHIADTYDVFKEIMSTKRGFIRALWCENPACEKKIKEETKASTRCLPLDTRDQNGLCISCGKPAIHQWVFAQAY